MALKYYWFELPFSEFYVADVFYSPFMMQLSKRASKQSKKNEQNDQSKQSKATNQTKQSN